MQKQPSISILKKKKKKGIMAFFLFLKNPKKPKTKNLKMRRVIEKLQANPFHKRFSGMIP